MACSGDNGQLKITVEVSNDENPATLTYQWQKSDDRDGVFIDISGGISSILSFASFTTSDNGFYRCIVTTDISSEISGIAEINISSAAPVISEIILDNNMLCEGASKELSVNVSNVERAIRQDWYHNGTALNRPNSAYTIYNATASSGGNYFYIAVNACDSVASEVVTLNYVSKPRISSQIIRPDFICAGEDISLTATATGDDLSYLWLRNGTQIPDEDENILNIEDIQPSYENIYKMVAYNECSGDTTQGLYIPVNTLPQITADPRDTDECIGTTVTFIVTADGTLEQTYQWYNEAGILENETETSLQVEAGSGNGFYAVITNACGSVNTDTASIFLKEPPEFSRHADGGTYCVGDDVGLDVKVVGTTPISYQWIRNGADVYGTNMSGINSATLNIEDIVISQSGFYYCHVSNVCGSADSDSAEIILNEPITLIRDIEDQILCEGVDLSFSVRITGTEPIEFAWYKQESGEIVSTDEAFEINSISIDDAGEYYCIMTNACGEISTDTVEVTVKALPQITLQPLPRNICVGEDLELIVEAAGYAPLNYSWYRNESFISGESSNTLSYQSANINNSGEYFSKVWNECGEVLSETVEVSVGTPPSIIINPFDISICELDTIKLYVSVYGENYNVQWYFNDNPLGNQTDTLLQISRATISNHGDYYCSIYNGCASINSNVAEVIVKPAPHVNLGDDVNACQGESVTLSTEGDPEDYIGYNWNNGLTVSPSYTARLSGTFILEVTGTNYCKNRDTVVVTFHPKFGINLGEDEIHFCGYSMDLNAGQGAYSYLWSNGEINSSITVTESGIYKVTATGDSYGCETSDSVTVYFYEPISFTLGNDIREDVSSYVNIGILDVYEEYIWSTNERTSSISVNGEDYGIGSHAFWLKATSAEGCYHIDTIVVTFYQGEDQSVDLNDINNIVKVYPNPANDIFNISIEDGIIDKLYIYNAVGELILNKTIKNDKYTVDVTTFASGIYHLKILTGKNETVVKKLIRQ
jgi:hypothetical protein